MAQNSQQEKTEIFVSYIAEEEALAAIFKKHIETDFLQLVNLFAFSDIENNPAGGRWLEALERALSTAEIQLVLCSKKSVNRPWINFEAGAGWLKKIPVVPICHTGMKVGDLPLPFQSLVAVEANREEGLKKLYATIADHVRRKTYISTPSKFREILEQINTFEEGYKTKLIEEEEVDQRLNDIDQSLNALTLGIAELELREKITVIKHRAKKLIDKPHEFGEDEAILLAGDSTAGLPLFQYAPERTRCEYINAVYEAMTALGEEYILSGKPFQERLIENLTNDISTITEKDKDDIRKQLQDLLEKCTLRFNERRNETSDGD